MGAAGVLLLALTFAGDTVREMVGPQVDFFLTLFMVVAPIGALIALFVLRTEHRNARLGAIGILTSLMVISFVLAIAYREAPETIPPAFGLLIFALMTVAALALLATTFWHNWNYRGSDTMRSPAHVP